MSRGHPGALWRKESTAIWVNRGALFPWAGRFQRCQGGVIRGRERLDGRAVAAEVPVGGPVGGAGVEAGDVLVAGVEGPSGLGLIGSVEGSTVGSPASAGRRSVVPGMLPSCGEAAASPAVRATPAATATQPVTPQIANRCSR